MQETIIRNGAEQEERYDCGMKTPPDNPEFERFTEAMRRIVSVPKIEVMRRIEEERAHSIKGKRGPKRGPKTQPPISYHFSYDPRKSERSESEIQDSEDIQVYRKQSERPRPSRAPRVRHSEDRKAIGSRSSL
jgi:hypothetical protein